MIERDEIVHGHGGDARMVAAWLGCFEGMLTRRAIAAGLRLRSSGRASDLIRIGDAELDRNPLLRVAVDRCCDLLRGSPSALAPPPGNNQPVSLTSTAPF